MIQEKLYSLKKPDSLLAETFNIAIIDSGCTETVCGEVVLQYCIDSLGDTDKDKINICKCNNSFTFDNSIIIRPNRLVTIPVFIRVIQAKLTAGVIAFEIPLLLSKDQ